MADIYTPITVSADHAAMVLICRILLTAMRKGIPAPVMQNAWYRLTNDEKIDDQWVIAMVENNKDLIL